MYWIGDGRSGPMPALPLERMGEKRKKKDDYSDEIIG